MAAQPNPVPADQTKPLTAVKSAAQTTTPAQAKPSSKKRSKLVLIMGVLIVAMGGGGAWYFMRPSTGDGATAVPSKPAMFLPIEMFTVNLLPQGGQPQFIQLGLTLKLLDSSTLDKIKERMPEIRNRILIVLSGKQAGELLSINGKQQLARELADSVSAVIAPPAVKAPTNGVPESAAAPVEQAAEGEKPAPQAEAPDKAIAPVQVPAIEVLFTAFIIQ